MNALRVCIDARFDGNSSGGIAQVVIGLASGLSALPDGDEEYLFLTSPGHDEWVRPYVSGPCRVIHSPAPAPSRASRFLNGLPLLRASWNRLSPFLGRASFSVPQSDGTIERHGVDVMHFPSQRAFLTDVPSIYHPHDLQHVHLPHFFDPRQRMTRDLLFRTLCDRAELVAVVSSWVKEDLVRQYGLSAGKVAVVPFAPVLAAYPEPSAHDLGRARRKFGLPDAFVFYPAQTFPHKNHLGLVEAVHRLREETGLRVPLVSSGHRTEFHQTLERRVRELGMADQVTFVGFVEPLELQCLYRLARAAVIPSKFEAASFPVWEAFLAGVPVACSDVTSLPRQAGDAAIVFDPSDSRAIGEAVRKLWTDEALRRELALRGRRNVARFTWDRTARHFRAHYRRLGRRPLADEDRALVDADPLL